MGSSSSSNIATWCDDARALLTLAFPTPRCEDKRRGWIELKRHLLGPDLAPQHAEESESASGPTPSVDIPPTLQETYTDQIEKTTGEASGNEGSGRFPEVDTIEDKLRRLNVPLDLFPASIEDFMVQLRIQKRFQIELRTNRVFLSRISPTLCTAYLYGLLQPL